MHLIGYFTSNSRFKVQGSRIPVWIMVICPFVMWGGGGGEFMCASVPKDWIGCLRLSSHCRQMWPKSDFFFCPHVTQICFCHDSVNSTNRMESDIFNSDLCHFSLVQTVSPNPILCISGWNPIWITDCPHSILQLFISNLCVHEGSFVLTECALVSMVA